MEPTGVSNYSNELSGNPGRFNSPEIRGFKLIEIE